MARAIRPVIVSCTELPQYGRLVEFLTEVAALAAERGGDDPELVRLLSSVSEDLLEMANWR